MQLLTRDDLFLIRMPKRKKTKEELLISNNKQGRTRGAKDFRNIMKGQRGSL